MMKTEFCVSLWLFLLGFQARLALGFVAPYRSSIDLPSPRLAAIAGADIDQSQASTESQAPVDPSLVPLNRGKVNEIDFCIAPADVSLSRSYSSLASEDGAASSTPQTLSLTRALNNASNRAIRRILLARSWPSAEALNLSLRQVLAERAAREKQSPDIPLEDEGQQLDVKGAGPSSRDVSKCPVPRPILNILMRRRNDPLNAVAGDVDKTPRPRSRTDEEYVADQIQAFRDRYSALPGYPLAEAYLECILSLATSGLESTRVQEVMDGGAYGESYRRVVTVLGSVGVVFEPVQGQASQRRIAAKLLDQDVCLSMLDKIGLKMEEVDKVDRNATQAPVLQSVPVETAPESEVTESALDDQVDRKKKKQDDEGRFFLKFWNRAEGEDDEESRDSDEGDEEFELNPTDLGGVLLSAEEPSMTRQLNVLANIVRRALLFGGDQELLVLSETLHADTPAFINRWYPGTDGEVLMMDPKDETRPGVQYLNCIVQLLKNCYRDGVVTTLEAPLPLIDSYANAYERLTASLVELGSGYIKPIVDVKEMPIPRTAQEEFGRFAVWESSFRKTTPDVSTYPEDLEGTWEVKDEIGGETIGISTVLFQTEGRVEVSPPMQGLRWRLDPGPTHLDTCTFQVLSDDGTILQYRGFIDRGARLEARFSKRPIRIRGSVMFQMRDGESASMGEDYWRDMLPINYKTGTTKFVMTKR